LSYFNTTKCWHNNINIELMLKFMLIYIIETWIKITAKFHVLLKKIKTTIKICGISKQNLWFSTTSTCNSSYSSQNYMSNNSFLFYKTPSFSIISSHITMIQNQQEFKIQTNKVPQLVPILNALFIQNHVLILSP